MTMPRHRGFSLIEVLVALSLLAAALVLVFATLRGATRATAHAEATAQRSERLRAVQGFLRARLGDAMASPIEIDADSGQAVYFRGDARRIEYIAPMPGYLSYGGPYLQTVEFVRGERGAWRLQFSFRLMTPDGPLAPEREPEVLLDGIADGEFAFRTQDANSRPTAWLGDWHRAAQLPPLVRLQLRADDLVWPQLVVRLRAGVPYATPPDAGEVGR